jgi:hypothetical protein
MVESGDKTDASGNGNHEYRRQNAILKNGAARLSWKQDKAARHKLSGDGIKAEREVKPITYGGHRGKDGSTYKFRSRSFQSC